MPKYSEIMPQVALRSPQSPLKMKAVLVITRFQVDRLLRPKWLKTRQLARCRRRMPRRSGSTAEVLVPKQAKNRLKAASLAISEVGAKFCGPCVASCELRDENVALPGRDDALCAGARYHCSQGQEEGQGAYRLETWGSSCFDMF